MLCVELRMLWSARVIAALALFAVFGVFAALPQTGPFAGVSKQIGLQPPVAYAVACNGPNGFGYSCVASNRGYAPANVGIGDHCDDCF
jgi:hypothetical protein